MMTNDDHFPVSPEVAFFFFNSFLGGNLFYKPLSIIELTGGLEMNKNGWGLCSKVYTVLLGWGLGHRFGTCTRRTSRVLPGKGT